jgi:hypothetical protein
MAIKKSARFTPAKSVKATPLKTVIIFGAGASAAEGAPIQSALFNDYFDLNLHKHGIVRIAEMDKELRAFFAAFFGITGKMSATTKKRYPTFEEALGIVELALQRAESFKQYPATPEHPRLVRTWLYSGSQRKDGMCAPRPSSRHNQRLNPTGGHW